MNVNCTKTSFHFIYNLDAGFCRAAREENAYSRMKEVVRWYLSGFYKKPKVHREAVFLANSYNHMTSGLLKNFSRKIKTNVFRRFDVSSKETVTFALIMMEITSKLQTTL